MLMGTTDADTGTLLALVAVLKARACRALLSLSPPQPPSLSNQVSFSNAFSNANAISISTSLSRPNTADYPLPQVTPNTGLLHPA